MENLWLYPGVYLAVTYIHVWQRFCISCLDMPHQVILELLLKLQPLALSKCHFISINILKNVWIAKIKNYSSYVFC